MDHPVRTINIFNTDIPIRNYGCSNKGQEPKIINPARLNLFIQLTQNCNANCRFCEYHNPSTTKFNISKLEEILKEINSKIIIGKLNFTGGEPTLNQDLFCNVFDCVKNNINYNKKPEVTVNTNGYNLEILLRYQDIIDSIGLSYHHYNDNKNFEIFGTNSVANSKRIKEFQEQIIDKSIVQMRCNLISGYIDSFEEIKKYLNNAISLGVKDCGFVTLMPLNNFCKEHQIDFANLINTNDSAFVKVNYWNRLDENLEKSLCNCANYVYSNEEGQMCKFYSRLFCNANLHEGQLVYDGQNLRYGFGGKIIY